jgi:hypothetical protein
MFQVGGGEMVFCGQPVLVIVFHHTEYIILHCSSISAPLHSLLYMLRFFFVPIFLIHHM